MPSDPPHPEFDNYADEYSELLSDPIRDIFSGSPEFFFVRKWDVLRGYMKRIGMRPAESSWLDVGCGQGDLLRIGAGAFRSAVGCDLSAKMLESCTAAPTVLQTDPRQLPFPDSSFDLVTAVCVYHHVPDLDRLQLTREIARVLRPAGAAAIIEHNPLNPATQIIVARTPVDRDARLLTARLAARLLADAGLPPEQTTYFLYFPKALYARLGTLERWLSFLPLGGQYSVFGRKSVQ